MVKKIRIKNKVVPYEISRRKVKYSRLEFSNGKLLVIAPPGVKASDVIKRHQDWVIGQHLKIHEAVKAAKKTNLKNNMSREKLKVYVEKKTKELAGENRVKINRVRVRKMTSRWGSMNSNKNITISSYARFLPEKLIEYIIFHEIAHFLNFKHDKKFWEIIESRYRNYKKYEQELSGYWFLLARQKKKA